MTKQPEEREPDQPLALSSSAVLGPPATCGECQHSAWQRTPTGRIKRGICGSCTKEKELLSMYVVAKHPPCLAMGRTTLHRIWPDDDASGCPLRA